MGTRTALRQSRWLTLAVVFGLVWTGLIIWRVYNTIEWEALGSGQIVGSYVVSTVVSGVAGIVVLAGFFALLVALYGELAETGPKPSTWPPE